MGTVANRWCGVCAKVSELQPDHGSDKCKGRECNGVIIGDVVLAVASARNPKEEKKKK